MLDYEDWSNNAIFPDGDCKRSRMLANVYMPLLPKSTKLIGTSSPEEDSV